VSPIDEIICSSLECNVTYILRNRKNSGIINIVGKVVEAKEAKTAYNEAKRVAKRVVWLAKSEDDISPTGDGVFRLA